MSTLKDISERTGVSKSIISRYLNKDSNVRLGEAKKKLIDIAVKEMNYQPSHMARSLRNGRSRLLGLVVGGITDPFFSNLTEACLKYTEGHGYQLLISLTSWDEDREKKCLKMLLERQVDGVIYAPRFPDDEVFQQQMLSCGTPIVLMNRRIPGYPSVCQDPCVAFDRMLDMFARQGCRELAAPCYANSEHSKIFIAACEKHGIQAKIMIFDSNQEVVERMFQQRHRFLYISSCWHAKDLLALIRERESDYRPVFVTGYNLAVDFIEYEGLLGVLHGHMFQYIRSVVNLLVERIENSDSAQDAADMPKQIEVAFYPREEFLRLKDSLEDTVSKATI